MGTGIVSVALSLAHQEVLSRIWLVLAAAAWVVLAILVGLRLLWDRPGMRAEARTPAGLTIVAATAVLGSRLLTGGRRTDALVLLVVAVTIWLGLSVVLLRHRRLPSTGSSFMLTVSIQSLAVLAAPISATEAAPWLAWAALVACAFGIATYPLVLVRFDPRQLLVGRGDQWVAGGALGISALATSQISLAAARVGTLRAMVPTLHTMSVLIWAGGIVWLAALIAGEIASPRLGYDARRWSTIFPVGMYAASSHEVARTAGLPPVDAVATVWTWVSVALWLLVAAAMVRRLASGGSRIRTCVG